MTLLSRIPSLLIANRGEIACRIIRTARRLGIRTIAVYSDADVRSMHVRLADDAVRIGPAPARESYLNIEAVLAAAAHSGALAVHPGYGFLSENADFAEACLKTGLIFVGPPVEAIRTMGLKDLAKTHVAAAGVPVVPGYQGDDQSLYAFQEAASRIGYPVLIKAVAGGGGKGMKRVNDPAGLSEALASAQREAVSAFGDGRLLLEKYMARARHIEMQIFADTFGNTVHLLERDCSLQRRHQKVIEEAPAPLVSHEMRTAMGRAAVEAARSVGYTGAGTVEFIIDASGPLTPDGFYFMEMNTRLQVEHPVTEAITGLDLVEWQLRVAAGEALPWQQSDIHMHGHAIEARLYAEDPSQGFLPSSGKIYRLDLDVTDSIRVDAGVCEGDEISSHYDPMIAKLIAHGSTREDARQKLHKALAAIHILGPVTNARFLTALLDQPDFISGDVTTGLIADHMDGLISPPNTAPCRAACLGAIGLLFKDRHDDVSPWAQQNAFQFCRPRQQHLPVVVNGEIIEVTLQWGRQPHNCALYISAGEVRLSTPVDDPTSLLSNIPHVHVRRNTGETSLLLWLDGLQVHIHMLRATADSSRESDGIIRAPMHGRLTMLFHQSGDKVLKGQPLVVIEAMKMEHTLMAPFDGSITHVEHVPGDQVASGIVLVVMEADRLA